MSKSERRRLVEFAVETGVIERSDYEHFMDSVVPRGYLLNNDTVEFDDLTCRHIEVSAELLGISVEELFLTLKEIREGIMKDLLLALEKIAK